MLPNTSQTRLETKTDCPWLDTVSIEWLSVLSSSMGKEGFNSGWMSSTSSGPPYSDESFIKCMSTVDGSRSLFVYVYIYVDLLGFKSNIRLPGYCRSLQL